MNRLVSIAGRTLRCTGDTRKNFRLGALYPGAYVKVRYSTKASELTNALPKFWVAKMRSSFSWIDTNGDGYITENDFVDYEKEMIKLLPDASKEQKKDLLVTNRKGVWDDLYDAKGKGPDYKITEDMYIERWFNITTQEGSEYWVRREWENAFDIAT